MEYKLDKKIKSVFIILVLYSLIILSACNSNPYQQEQEKLASQLGIKINDYPYPYSFPISYFDTILQPGMSMEVVHGVIRGYEKVWKCSDSREIYYYFSTNDDTALRFQVFYYLHQFTYEKLQGEDDDSRSIITRGCVPGLINKPS